MIYVEQAKKLSDTFDLASKKGYFDGIEESISSDAPINSDAIIKERGNIETTIFGKDKIKVSVSIDISFIYSMRDQALVAAILTKAMTECESKSIKKEVNSRYLAPSRIENAYKHLKPKVGQTEAMRACTEIDIDGKGFAWKQARLHGFDLSISTTKALHSFDPHQISRQRDLLTRQLTKNLSYHLQNTLQSANIVSPNNLNNRAKNLENDISLGR